MASRKKWQLPLWTFGQASVAVRLHPCGMIVPALVERAWSVHRKGSKSMTVESDCPLASESCVKVHIVPLEKTSGGGYWVHSQLRSLSVNPHHADGIILNELPPRSVQVREADVYLTVMIAKSCKEGWKEMVRGRQLPTTVSSSPSDSSGQSMTVFTYDCFPPNKTGKSNVCAYMEVMKSMYEWLQGRSLCDADGRVNLPRRIFKGTPPLWPVLVARTPGYFDIVSASLKNKPVSIPMLFGPSSALCLLCQMQARSCSFWRRSMRSVWMCCQCSDCFYVFGGIRTWTNVQLRWGPGGMFQHMAIQEKKVHVVGRMNQCNIPNIPNIPRFCFILFLFLYSIYAIL